MTDRPRPRRFAGLSGLRGTALAAVLALAAGAATWVLLADGDDAPVARLGSDAGAGEVDDLTDPEPGGDLAGLSYQELGGTTVELADLAGKPLVINFWASWCPPCLKEMPIFEEVHQDLGEQVTFLGLAVQDRPADTRARAEQIGVTYPLGRDVDDRVYLAVGAARVPTTAFVDADGVVQRVRMGELDEAELRALLSEHLGIG